MMLPLAVSRSIWLLQLLLPALADVAVLHATVFLVVRGVEDRVWAVRAMS